MKVSEYITVAFMWAVVLTGAIVLYVAVFGADFLIKEARPPLAHEMPTRSLSLEELKRTVPQNESGHFMFHLPELFYMTREGPETQKLLAEQTIELKGQFLKGDSRESGKHRFHIYDTYTHEWMATRYTMLAECDHELPQLSNREWVHMVAKIQFEQEGGETTPLLKVINLESVTEP